MLSGGGWERRVSLPHGADVMWTLTLFDHITHVLLPGRH